MVAWEAAPRCNSLGCAGSQGSSKSFACLEKHAQFQKLTNIYNREVVPREGTQSRLSPYEIVVIAAFPDRLYQIIDKILDKNTAQRTNAGF